MAVGRMHLSGPQQLADADVGGCGFRKTRIDTDTKHKNSILIAFIADWTCGMPLLSPGWDEAKAGPD